MSWIAKAKKKSVANPMSIAEAVAVLKGYGVYATSAQPVLTAHETPSAEVEFSAYTTAAMIEFIEAWTK